MAVKVLNCPACNGSMIYRLGEYECEDCGHRSAGHEEGEQDNLPVRRPVTGSSGYTPGNNRGFVDGNIQRGTRQR